MSKITTLSRSTSRKLTLLLLQHIFLANRDCAYVLGTACSPLHSLLLPPIHNLTCLRCKFMLAWDQLHSGVAYTSRSTGSILPSASGEAACHMPLFGQLSEHIAFVMVGLGVTVEDVGHKSARVSNM
eukprot:2129254-Amphidinium_carterae.2